MGNILSIELSTLKLHTSELVIVRLDYNKTDKRYSINVGTTCRDGVEEAGIYLNSKLVSTLRDIPRFKYKSTQNLSLSCIKEIKIEVKHPYGNTNIIISKNFIDAAKRKIKENVRTS